MPHQFIRYSREGGRPGLGLLDDGTIHALSGLPGDEPSLGDLCDVGYLDALSHAVANGALPTVERSAVRALAPVPEPGKIVCVGLNYRDHAEEGGQDIPEAPMLFGKAPTAVTNPGDPIVHPPGEDVDYEVELAAVVGRTAKNVDAEDAEEYIAGYTACNDVSGRKAQFSDGQFLRGKSFDTFAPMGPTLVVGDDYDPNDVDVECRVNGEVRQSSNTEQFIFDLHEVVEYVTHNMTLRPGDVISTGTPAGVGAFMDDGLLSPGDVCEVEVEGVGILRNPVVAAPDAA